MSNPVEPVFETLRNVFRMPNAKYSNKNDNFEVWTPAPIEVVTVNQECKEIFPQVPTAPTDFANAHSCPYCAKIVIDPSVDEGSSSERKYSWCRLRLDYSITDIYNAGIDGCLFFSTLFAHGGGHVVDPRQRNLAAIDDPLERFIAKWGQGQFLMWLDMARNDFDDVREARPSWMHRKVPGVDERYSCRIPKPYPSNLDVCALPGDEAAKWVTSRPVNQDFGSVESFQAARRCLAECHATHETCLRDQSVVPSRLVDIGADGQTPRLINTEDKKLDFCALSYCWGGEQSYKTTTTNLEAYQQHINLPGTAKTILDAITATKNLGLRYLWIDVLCIVQNNGDDIVRELARMPGIYKGAYLTLVAANASSSKEGFLQERKSDGSVYKFPFKCPDGTMSSVYLYQRPSKYGCYTDPIQKRAWTLQESILSPRTLTFGGERMFWNCHTPFKKEVSGVPRQPRDYISRQVRSIWPPRDIKDAMKEWRSIVVQYTKRSSTVPSDKLVAIAGIAEEFARGVTQTYPDKFAQYSAGLWHFELPNQLLWKRNTWTSLPLSQRPKEYRAPTWSWASIDDQVQYQGDCHPVIEVLGDQITLKSQTLVYGEVTFGLLAVAGRVKKAVMTKGGTRIQDPHMPGFESLEIASVNLDAIEQGKESISNMQVWLLEVGVQDRKRHSALGLVLAPAGLPDQAAFGGPRPLGDANTAIRAPDNAFSPENQHPDSDALIHLRRRPTPPPPPPASDSDWDAGAREDSPYHGYYFRRIGFFEMLVDFRERSEVSADGGPGTLFEQENDPDVEHLSWFDDCQKRAIFLV